MENNHNDTLYLFLGIGLFLLCASAIGYLLKIIKGNDAIIRNLNTRINAWWMMVIIIGVAFWLGNIAVIGLFFFISLFALREFIAIIPKTSDDDYALLFAFYLVLPLQYSFISLGWSPLLSLFIPIYIFLLLPILVSFSGTTKDFLARTAKIQWALMITVFGISCVPALLTLEIKGYENRHLLLIAFFVIVVQISDVLQYIFGKLFGKHQIAPHLSPSKTVEGFIGGICSASLIGAALYWITPFSMIQAGLIALLLTLLGFMGGLVMSAIKRDSGIKDWGSMIEGHGGILDRFDSICFAAPIFFHLVRYGWT